MFETKAISVDVIAVVREIEPMDRLVPKVKAEDQTRIYTTLGTYEDVPETYAQVMEWLADAERWTA